jgi:CMP-N-acetylneuraminic acid synthetase
MKIVIPARKGSKGLPFKNRILFKHTADIIPDDLKQYVYVLSDDKEIINMGISYGFNITHRPSLISQDETSTSEVMNYFVAETKSDHTDDIIMLYLTYPQRKWEDVVAALRLMNNKGAKSLLCKKDICSTPFLMLEELDDGRGNKLIDHDLYRRQDYPKCFELSHYISIFNASVINKLNNNMYNEDTIFMSIPNDTIDVDTQKDLDKYNGSN